MNTKQQEFIILRADGISFDKISNKLKTSKPTLIQWSKLYEDEIKELQFAAFIKIKEAYSWNTKKKYETLLEQLEKIDAGILKADLTQTSLKDLFTVKNNILFQIESIEKKVETNPRLTKTNELGYTEALLFKLNEVE
ncbi:hypothetical protein [Arcobacter peruensis]|uniref:hypothetical protein n=1 Tax=Arcobacter peruensis TaxID=2320140 RepID=UPI000F07D831|nr:hypothetical protein [Arcobacter peruensis]